MFVVVLGQQQGFGPLPSHGGRVVLWPPCGSVLHTWWEALKLRVRRRGRFPRELGAGGGHLSLLESGLLQMLFLFCD